MKASNLSLAHLGPAARAQVVAALGEQERAKEARSKYGNKTCVVDGFRFDSQKEAAHYIELKAREAAGQIMFVKCQPAFRIEVNGVLICDYVADFSYVDTRTGQEITVDVKSKATKTAVYRLKKKLVLAVHAVEVIEV